MKLMHAILCATFLVAVSPSTFAQRGGTVRGAGPSSCAEFIDSKGKPGADLFYGQWALGFISSINLYASIPQVEVPEPKTALLFAEKFCRENPLQNFTAATISLMIELQEKSGNKRNK